MFKLLCSVLLTIGVAISLQAQSVSIPEIRQTYRNAMWVDQLAMAGNYEQAIVVGREAVSVFKRAGWTDAVVKMQSTIARSFVGSNQLDSALLYARNNLQIIDKRLSEVSTMGQSVAYFIAGAAYLEVFSSDTARTYLHHSLDLMSNFTTSNYSGLPDSLVEIVRPLDAAFLNMMGGRATLVDHFEGFIYNYLGVSYLESLEVEKAEGYIKLAIERFQRTENRQEEINNWLNLAMIYMKATLNGGLADRHSSNLLRQTVMRVEQMEDATRAHRVALQRMVAYYNYFRNDLETALSAFEQSYLLIQQATAEEVEQTFLLPKQLLTNNLKSDILMLRAELRPDAGMVAQLDSLLREIQTVPQSKNRPYLEWIGNFSMIRIAAAYGNLGQWDKAEQTYQRAFEWFMPKHNLYDLDPEQMVAQSTHPSLQMVLIELLVRAGATLEQKYRMLADPVLLRQANQIYLTGCKIGENYRRYFSNQPNELQWLANSLVALNITVDAFYIGAIRTKIQLDPQDHQGIFDLMETNKAFILRSNINWTKGTLALSEEIRQKERAIQQKSLELLSQLKETRVKNDRERLLALENAWIDQQKEFETHYRELRDTFPKYYNFFYDNTVPSLEEVKNVLLDDHSAILDYKLGNKGELFLMCITQDTEVVLRMEPMEKFDLIIDRFYRYSSSPDSIRAAGNMKTMLEDAYRIYDRLVKPVEEVLKGIDHLIIIPSTSLQRVNFDLLLTRAYTDNEKIANKAAFLNRANFAVLDLMLKKYSIQYGASVRTLLDQHKLVYRGEDKKPLINYGGFEPLYDREQLNRTIGMLEQKEQYKGTKNAIDVLEFEEVQNTHKLFAEHEKMIWLKKRASEEQFRQAVENYAFNIMHVSAHGFLGPLDPLNSLILLAGSSESDYDDQIRVGELYGMHIAANLAIISSCNSGNSNYFVDEEGFISIGRGFFYAGCPSVIMGYWQMDVESTEQIIVNTCRYIKEKGWNYARALQQAKLDYLNESNHNAVLNDPYYWSALTLWGNNRVLFD